MPMSLTDYHATYCAHDLTRRAAGGSLERLSMSLFDATVDMNSDDTWKVGLIEEDLHRLMFDTEGA